jgi:hypothetical protein
VCGGGGVDEKVGRSACGMAGKRESFEKCLKRDGML